MGASTCCAEAEPDTQFTVFDLSALKKQCLISEATGVADPVAIIQVFQDEELNEHMEVDKIITVLDADFWEVREGFGTLFFSQLREADLILLNKIDTIDNNKIPQFLKEIHETMPNSRVIPTIRCRVDPESLWTAGRRKDFGFRPDQFFNVVPPNDAHDEETDFYRQAYQGSNGASHSVVKDEKIHYIAFSFTYSAHLDENCFKQFTEKLPWEVFRMKGPVCFYDRTVLVNYVGGKCEWADWAGTEETRLAFVGWKVSGEETISKLRKCIVRS